MIGGEPMQPQAQEDQDQQPVQILQTWQSPKGEGYQTRNDSDHGWAERINRSLSEEIACMMVDAGLAATFWAEALLVGLPPGGV